jgi:protein-tyrosine kinase
MTKIFEALEQAEQERAGAAKPAAAGSPPSASSGSTREIQVQETMISLYQNLSSMFDTMGGKCILFMGSRPGEGASTLVRQFAQVAARQLHRSVLLLDADLTHPSQLGAFGISPQHGWEETVRNGTPLSATAYPAGADKRLAVSQLSVHAVSSPPVFGMPELDTFLETVKQDFDLVLIDAPAAADSPDGLALARKVDGVILVIEAEKTRWEVAENVRTRITKQGGTILGVILNKRRHPIPKFIYRMI